MWVIKLKVKKEQTRKTNKPKFVDADNSMEVTRGKWGGSSKGPRGSNIW